jgi:hypothetical protein
MRVASVLAVVILELVVARPFTVASQLSTPVARDPSGYCVSAAEHVLLTRINQVRRQDASSPPVQSLGASSGKSGGSDQPSKMKGRTSGFGSRRSLPLVS